MVDAVQIRSVLQDEICWSFDDLGDIFSFCRTHCRRSAGHGRLICFPPHSASALVSYVISLTLNP